MSFRFPFRRNTTSPRRAAPRRRLDLVRLEDRTVPSFAVPVLYPAGADGWGNLVAADFNGDGNKDLVLGNGSGGPAKLLLGNSDGTFQAARPLNTGYDFPWSLSAADFNGDGKTDLVVAHSWQLTVLIGNGDGSFQPPNTVFYSLPSARVATGDFNHDGKIDFVALGTDWYFDYATLLLGHGDGTFSQASTVYAGDGLDTDGLAVGDFNEDGNLDVIAETGLSQVDAVVLLGHGDGTLTYATDYLDWPHFDDSGSAVRAADLNGDGHLDLLDRGYFALGIGDGTFGPLQSGAGSAMASADINGDQIPDLVGAGGSLYVRLNNGTFGPAQSIGTGFAFSDVVVSDFNHDGMIDAAAADGASGNVAVFLNTGNWVQMPTVSISDASVVEGNSGTTAMNFTLTLSAAQSQAVSIQFSTANGSATAGSDYTAASGPVTFAPGQTTKTVTINVLGDTTPETDETLSVNLHDPVGLAINDGTALGTITNDDFTLAIYDVTITEGNTGTQSANFSVTLSGASTQTVTVQFLTSNGTATSGSDFQSAGGTLTFAAGQTSKTITVPVIGDRLPEASETFVVNLSSPVNATIADSQGVGTILDNEPRISISDVSLLEGKNGTTSFSFIVTLSMAYDQAVTMLYHTTDGTAKTSDSDYVSQSGTLTFAAGQTSKTITIVVNGDKKKESNEEFYVDLTASSGNSLFADTRGVGTILNDD